MKSINVNLGKQWVSAVLVLGTLMYAPFSVAGSSTTIYETDGHYWTVLLVGALLDIPEAEAIAYAAEYPDNVMNDDGYIVHARLTYLNPKYQKKVHALTGGNPEHEKSISRGLFLTASTPRQIGTAAHRLGDSYAHAKARKNKMYPHIVGHLFHMKKPDQIREDPAKYLEYVQDLVYAMGGSEAEIDMFVFNYISESGFSSKRNAAILKAEYNRLTGAIAFSIRKEDLNIVDTYLALRMVEGSYAIHTNSDEKGRQTTTIILLANGIALSNRSISPGISDGK